MVLAEIGMPEVAHAVPMIDWIAVVILLGGIASGVFSGLARSFGTLLWLLAALWLGTHLAPQFISWMPRTAQPDDPRAVETAFGLIAGVVILLPIVARLIGGAAGKKKDGGEIKHKAFGALVGLIFAVLLFTWAAPFMIRFPLVARDWDAARSPRIASAVADNVSYLFPPGHRDTLRESLGSTPTFATPAVPEPAEPPSGR